MKNLLMTISLAVVILGVVGCARSPRLNLAGLGGGSYVPGNSGSRGPEFQEVKPGEVGQEEKIPPAGNWVSEKENLLNDQNFLRDPQEWGERVYFAYNRNDIRSSERKVLDDLAAYLQENKDLALVIEGHADQRGEEEYNRALGERRALTVRGYLEALGISLNRMFTISYGEDRPADPDAKDESGWKLNRRVQFLVGHKK